MRSLIRPGHYYRRLNGPFEEVSAGEPDAYLCRRLADFGRGQLPKTAGIAFCVDCGSAVIFNPNGPHQDAPKICLQCAGIVPLPLEDES